MLNYLPCEEIEKYPLCVAYCKWHKSFFSGWSKEKFLTVMRYALSQRKIILEPKLPDEKQLAEELFGSEKVKNLSTLVSPKSLPILCHRKDEGFTRNEIGMSAKLCNGFFPTPTDVGICFPKNLNINKVVWPKVQYNYIFDADEQFQEENINGGTLWSESTIIINTDYLDHISHTYRRYLEAKCFEVQLQLHQSKELGHMLLDYNYELLNIPLTLATNHEYFIDITPKGEASTAAFRDFDVEKGNCQLDTEVDENSVFKTYAPNNCQYECHVKKAIDICFCIPWDFLSITDVQECDVFGRTCFFDAMKISAKSANDSCNHCIKECDFI